jgi:hypothetical protein
VSGQGVLAVKSFAKSLCSLLDALVIRHAMIVRRAATFARDQHVSRLAYSIHLVTSSSSHADVVCLPPWLVLHSTVLSYPVFTLRSAPHALCLSLPPSVCLSHLLAWSASHTFCLHAGLQRISTTSAFQLRANQELGDPRAGPNSTTHHDPHLLSATHISCRHVTPSVCLAGLQRISTTSASLPPASQGLAHPHQHLQHQAAYPPEPPAAVAQPQQQQVLLALPPHLLSGRTALTPLVKCQASGRVEAA